MCNTLQHTATHCNTLQHTATHCNTLQTNTRIVPRGVLPTSWHVYPCKQMCIRTCVWCMYTQMHTHVHPCIHSNAYGREYCHVKPALQAGRHIPQITLGSPTAEKALEPGLTLNRQWRSCHMYRGCSLTGMRSVSRACAAQMCARTHIRIHIHTQAHTYARIVSRSVLPTATHKENIYCVQECDAYMSHSNALQHIATNKRISIHVCAYIYVKK